MSDDPEIQSLNAAAANAAAADDVRTAISLLRQVRDLQERRLGADHPDLTTTLSNLGLMLERAGELPEAGRCYRWAHAIAAAALPPNDPLVRESRENLDAFYQVHGRPAAPPRAQEGQSGGLEVIPRQRVSASPPPPPVGRLAPGPAPVLLRPASTVGAATAPTKWGRSAALAAVLIVACIAGSVALMRRSSSSNHPSANAEPMAASEPEAAPATDLATTADPRPVAVVPEATPALADPAVAEVAPPEAARRIHESDVASPPEAASALPEATFPPEARSKVPAENSTVGRPSGDSRGPAVVESGVCRTLSREGVAWKCDEANGVAGDSSISYYTRVRSAEDIVIRHRWSYGGRVVAVATLQVVANTGAGFRTFSSQTVSSLRPGEWQVAAVGPDGRILDERRFVVR
ncbi:MAG: DUF2914 domain-containing protein [Acidobacteriota bacterium]|nr:DUF2914 domain-containing protein [Acidobacteriota bacterium]